MKPTKISGQPQLSPVLHVIVQSTSSVVSILLPFHSIFRSHLIVNFGRLLRFLPAISILIHHFIQLFSSLPLTFLNLLNRPSIITSAILYIKAYYKRSGVTQWQKHFRVILLSGRLFIGFMWRNNTSTRDVDRHWKYDRHI